MSIADRLLEDIVLLSTADWDNPFWTNKQHVAMTFQRRGHRVLYVDSLGLRRASASTNDLQRGVRRLSKALQAPREVRSGLWVWSPVIIPFHTSRIVRTVNRTFLNRQVHRLLRKLRLRPDILWTYNPLTMELFDVSMFDTLIYHRVDDIPAQPGMPSAVLEEAERTLIVHSDFVFATSPKLESTASRWNANTRYLPNVADFSHFARALDPCTPVPADLESIPRPRLGFIGAITGYKLDFELLQQIARTKPRWSLVLIGKIGEGDPWTDIGQLRGTSNIHLLGPRSYEELPGYLKGFDVAILPSILNRYAESMFPMKFFEYLAAGRPVVSVDLPALRSYGHVVPLVRSAAEFIIEVERALADPDGRLGERLQLAREHTYESRTDRMLAEVRRVRLAKGPRRGARG